MFRKYQAWNEGTDMWLAVAGPRVGNQRDGVAGTYIRWDGGCVQQHGERQ